MNKKIRTVGAVLILVFWAVFTAFAWFSPPKAYSDTERSDLAQMPEITVDSLWSGSFMPKFEEFTLDQFPMRDTVRSVKALFHTYVLNQKDNNGLYMKDGFISKVEYPMSRPSVNNAAKRLSELYSTYLAETDCKVYLSLVPDKGYYMNAGNGYPILDYNAMIGTIRDALPEAQYVDITGLLTHRDYYFTDTHWRQEKLLPVAQAIANAMGVEGPKDADFNPTPVEKPFYGVYYGQAALPIAAEQIFLMESPLLEDCSVYHPTVDNITAVYDMEKLESKDLYDMFLSGAKDLLVIENPNAKTDRELVVFRDSYGSSLVPLLVQDYTTVTLIDTRYIAPALIGEFVNFDEQDVLFLYSTLILNNSMSLIP